MESPRILEKTEHYWVVAKPLGWFVHSPEDKRAQTQFRHRIMTRWFESEFNFKPSPIQRLDFLTEGVMIWALNSTAAGILNRLHSQQGFVKTYHAIVRGLTPDSGLIDLPLASDSSPDEVPCQTLYRRLAAVDWPVQIHSPHPTSRYSWVEVQLKTGRWHQIRRHFNRISHPIIGDREHGDSHHNRYFRDHLGLPSLLLKAHQLDFSCPFTGERRSSLFPLNERWQRLQKLFNQSEALNV